MNMTIKLCLLAAAILPAVCSAQPRSCDAKRGAIEREIDYARAHGNAARVDELETALAQLNANCTDASLRSDAQRKVDAAQRKLDQRQRELQEARAAGKGAKKIAERQRKLEEAHAEFERTLVEASQ